MSSTCVLVVGLHRSGTSVVAGILQHLGVNMGHRILPANAANPTGFWEDLDFLDVHHCILGDWKRPVVNFSPYVHYYRGLIARKSQQPLWGIKDPKLCFLLKEFSAAIKAELKIVVVNRNAHDVMKSMMAKSFDANISQGEAELICKAYRHARDTGLNGIDFPKISVEYQDIITNPKEVVSRIAEFVNVDITSEAIAYINPRLDHSHC